MFFIKENIMKNNHFFISDEGYTRAKKQLKKHLKNEGVDFSLSQCANLLAKSFGFDDENSIQKHISSQQIFENITYANVDKKEKIHDKRMLNLKKSKEEKILTPYNRLNQEQKYFSEILFSWGQAYSHFNTDIFKLTENGNNQDKISYLLKIWREINETRDFLKNAKIVDDKVILRAPTPHNIKTMEYMMPEMLKIYELTNDDIYRNIANRMVLYKEIEPYFYKKIEDRHNFYLQPNDFDWNVHKPLIGYYEFHPEDFKNEIKGDILILGNSDACPDILATMLKQIIQKETQVQIINMELDVPGDHNLPYKYEKGIKRIYISYAEDVESLKAYIKKSNPDYDYKNIGLCLKTKINPGNISYDFVAIS